MRSLTFLILTTSAATAATGAAAQQPDRTRTPEARARAEARATAQARDSVRVRGVSLEAEIERLASQLIEASRMQSQASREIRALTTRGVEQANREEVEVYVRKLQTQLRTAANQYQSLRDQLASLCDRTAKPQGYMGITFSAEMSADARDSGGEVFRFEENPTVESVEPGSPADRAGVRKGDEIVRIGGRPLVGQQIEFTRLLRPHTRLPIRLLRDGDARDVVLLIKERPASLDHGCPFLDARVMAAFGEPFTATILPPATGGIVRRAPAPSAEAGPRGTVRIRRGTVEPAPTPAVAPRSPGTEPTITLITPSAPDAPEAPSVAGGRSVFVVGPGANQMIIAGATIVRPNADLRETFGVERGVLVLDVARGTPAYISGLKGGDIIVSAGRYSVTSPLSIQRAMQVADDRQVELSIIRKRKPQTLTLKW